jgi:P4 family phage/plasmid primase-like protien
VSWEKLAARLQQFHLHDITYAEYLALNREEQSKLKDVGYFIGGQFKSDKRQQSDMALRSVITLDVDHLESWDIDAIADAYHDLEYVCHSTMKHSSETPRLRLVFPMTKDITPNKYEPIARKLADRMGMECFDDTTFQPARIMFWPAVTSDGEIFKHHNAGEFIAPKALLNEYEDWTDFAEWPHSSRVARIRAPVREAENPLTKPGVIGAFNRTFDIHAAIERFDLPYESTDHENRYRPVDATGPAGAVVYDDVFLYSHHESDAVGQQNVNAWDLVRIHKYGDEDSGDFSGVPSMQRPSSKQMVALAASIPTVQKELRASDLDELQDLDKGNSEDRSPDALQHAGKAGRSEPTLTFNSLLMEISGINVKAANLYDVCQSEIPRIAAARLDPQENSILAAALREKYPIPKPTKGSVEKIINITGKRLVGQLSDGRGGIADIEQDLVQAVLDDHFAHGKAIKRIARKYWTYERGLWAIVGDEWVKGKAIKTLSRLRVERPDDVLELVAAVGEAKTSSLARALWDMQAAILAEREQRDDPLGLMRTFPLPIINCMNCELHFDHDGQMEKRKHKAENFFTIRVDTEYKPKAKAKEWDRFNQLIWSETVDPDDMQRHLEELGGYIVQFSRWLKAWVLFHGPKDTGKSTVAEVFKALLGKAFLGQDLGSFDSKRKSTFAEQNLIGKLALVDDDFDKSFALPDGFIKKVSEEKSMTADIKYGDAVQFVSRALPIILSNHWPITRDVSDAFRERALVFPFMHKISGRDRSDERRNAMLLELPGILNRFIAGITRLRARGDWDVPMDCANAHHEWQIKSNPAGLFVSECIITDRNQHVKTSDVWQAYVNWHRQQRSTDRSMRGLSKGEFYERMDALVGIRSKIGGFDVYKHVKLTKEIVTELHDLDDF